MDPHQYQCSCNGGTSSFLCRQTSSKWIPKADQIRILKELYYTDGVRSPTAEQIQRISARLRQYGKIEGKNVFYWFQNHKARERQKKKLTVDNSTTNKERQKNKLTVDISNNSTKLTVDISNNSTTNKAREKKKKKLTVDISNNSTTNNTDINAYCMSDHNKLSSTNNIMNVPYGLSAASHGIYDAGNGYGVGGALACLEEEMAQ